MAELRRALKGVGAEYKVVKNTLSSIAAKDTPVEQVEDLFVGPIGIAFGFEDPIAVTNKLLEYADKNEKFKVKSGVIEGRLCTMADIKAISKLPPKNVLLGMLAGTMQAPASKLAAALNATVLQFAYALEALKTKKVVSE
jgi:large subunit ribosomal protein L10